MKTKKVEEEKTEKEARIYEIGYLLVPTFSEEEVPAQYGNLKELVASMGGQIVSDEMPKMINLAYQIEKVLPSSRKKYDMAYFGWVKFDMDPEKVLDLKKKLDQDENFIRFLIMKTVRENTIASKRMVSGAIRRRTPKAEGTTEINKEEIDKEIEAMVAA